MTTETIAKNLLAQYIEAELKGQDEQADSIEAALNEDGWYIVTTSEGLTVQRRSKLSDGALAELASNLKNLPTESAYRAISAPTDRAPMKKGWIIAFSILGGAALIFGVIVLVKFLKKPAKNATK